MAKRQLKNLLIFRFPRFQSAEEAHLVNKYVRENPAAKDFHIMVISEPGIDHLTIEEFGATRANGSDLRRLKAEIEDRLHLMGLMETMALTINMAIEGAKEKNALMKERAKMIQEQNRENNPEDFKGESIDSSGIMTGQTQVVAQVTGKKKGDESE